MTPSTRSMLVRRDAERFAAPPGEAGRRAVGDEALGAQHDRLVGAPASAPRAQPRHRLEVGALEPRRRRGDRGRCGWRARSSACAPGASRSRSSSCGRRSCVRSSKRGNQSPVRGIAASAASQNAPGSSCRYRPRGMRVPEPRAMQLEREHGAVGDQPGVGGLDATRAGCRSRPAPPAHRRRQR